MKWRVYYDNGAVRGYAQGLPETETERLGIICVLQERGDGNHSILHGAEYYLFDGQSMSWVGIGLNGLEDWVMNLLPQVKCVIKGRAIQSLAFKRIYEQVKVDKNLGVL